MNAWLPVSRESATWQALSTGQGSIYLMQLRRVSFPDAC